MHTDFFLGLKLICKVLRKWKLYIYKNTKIAKENADLMITKSAILITKVKIWTFLLCPQLVFGRALLQIEGKPEQLYIRIASILNTAMKTVHWSLAIGGKVVLPIQFLPFNAFLLSVPSWNQLVLHGRLLCPVLQAAEQQQSWCCFEPKNLLHENKSPAWIPVVPLPFGRAADQMQLQFC